MNNELASILFELSKKLEISFEETAELAIKLIKSGATVEKLEKYLKFYE